MSPSVLPHPHPRPARTRARRGESTPLSLDLLVGRKVNRLTVSGDLDLRAAGRLTRVLDRLEATHRPLVVALERVTFADTHGVWPLVEAADRRLAQGQPELQLHAPSPCVARVLDLLTHSGEG